MLAHQGGWDEILLTSAVVLGMLSVSRLRRRHAPPSASQPQPASTTDMCAYCGAELAPDDVRCASCGFRTRVPDEP